MVSFFYLQNNLPWDDFEEHIRTTLDDHFNNTEWLLCGWYKQSSKDCPRTIHLCTFYPRVPVEGVPKFMPTPEREVVGVEPAQPVRPEPCLVGPPPANAGRKLFLMSQHFSLPSLLLCLSVCYKSYNR
jgi:hypothetical protein